MRTEQQADVAIVKKLMLKRTDHQHLNGKSQFKNTFLA